jgi:putative ABC transport system permease protein
MQTREPCPPRVVRWLLSRLHSGENRLERLGDMEELYCLDLEDSGRFRATWRYVLRGGRVLVSWFVLALYWRAAMLRNYVVTAWRHMLRQKGHALINVAGLAIGLAAFSVIALWVRHELSFDRFHEKASRIYRVSERRRFPDFIQTGYRTPGPLAPELRNGVPEIEEVARVAWTGERVIRYQDRIHYEREVLTVDPEFFTLFSFSFVKGRPETALPGPFSMVITESTARKYFGDDDPLGKTLGLDNRMEFTVTGVVGDAPSNSHLQFGMIVPFEVVKQLGWAADDWDFSMALTYITLRPGTDRGKLEQKISGIVRSRNPDTTTEQFLQPLTRIRLHTNFDNPDSSGRIQYVYMFTLVGVLILGMACINFMNLATARSETRSREIGMRKVVGANRGNIIHQFLTESVLIAAVALIVAPLLIQLFLPEINKVTETSFSLADFAHPWLLAVVLGATLLTGLLSGSYPAMFLSAFQPGSTLKSQAPSLLRGSRLRKILVVFQMSISLILVIGSVVIVTQGGYLKNKDLGFNKEHVLSIPLGISNTENPKLYERFKEELRLNPSVGAVSGAFTHPTMFGTQAQDVSYNGNTLADKLPINLTSVTYDFVETLQIKLARGRSFSRDYGTERGNVLVNQQMERVLGNDSALGKVIRIGSEYEGRIVGVLKDFHMESVSSGKIGPVILFLNPNVNYIFVRVVPADMEKTLKSLEAAWKNTAPHLPFAYTFLDQDFARLYQDVESLGSVLKYMTVLAGLIACLGLLGLASFSARKRTKEIGVRKICGASSAGIVALLCRDFTKLVLFANLCAWPAAGWLMYSWLQSFPYRAPLKFWIFLSAGLGLLAVTLVTVSLQALKAALARPIDSLRYE